MVACHRTKDLKVAFILNPCLVVDAWIEKYLLMDSNYYGGEWTFAFESLPLLYFVSSVLAQTAEVHAGYALA